MKNQNPPASRAHTLTTAPSRSGRPSVSDTIRLTLGEPPEALSWQALSAVARIVTTPDDRPIRTIITGRRRMTTGSYPSTKCGRSLPFEGMNERAFLMHSEVDTQVIDYRAQPFRFEFVVDGAKRIYIADCVRLLEGGRIEVVEVKNDRRALKDAYYAMKLTRVREICARLGWTFRVVFKAQLFEPATVYRNVEEVQSRRQVAFDESHGYLAVDLLSRLKERATLGLLAEALGERRTGMAIAKAMMVARLIKIDLTQPLGSQSPVQLVNGFSDTTCVGSAS